MCVPCLRTQVDISEGIPKQVTVHFCKQCERFVYAANNNLALTLTPKRQRSWMYISLSCRYLQPPTTWMQCALESRELLALCLKKIKSSMTKVTIRNFFYNTDCLAECSYCVFCFTFFLVSYFCYCWILMDLCCIKPVINVLMTINTTGHRVWACDLSIKSQETLYIQSRSQCFLSLCAGAPHWCWLPVDRATL